jgi:hypothetical protein
VGAPVGEHDERRARRGAEAQVGDADAGRQQGGDVDVVQRLQLGAGAAGGGPRARRGR